MKFLKSLAIGTALALTLAVNPASAATVKIALLVKNLGNGFFDAANKGAQQAAKDLGDVEVIYTGPTKATPEGQIDIIKGGKRIPIKGVPKVLLSRYNGLRSVALDPDFATNHTLYISYADGEYSAARETTNGRIYRARLEGTQLIDGGTWGPYIPTPPFAEYVSGHSTFSAAAATVLTRFTGSRRFGASVTLKAGSSPIEPGLVPAEDLTLAWRTFDDAADEAGFSRRLGGIHFEDGDWQARIIGKKVGLQAWDRALRLFR